MELDVREDSIASISVRGEGAAGYISAQEDNITIGTAGSDGFPRFEVKQNDDVCVLAQFWRIQPESVTTRGPRVSIGLDVDDNPVLYVIGDPDECGGAGVRGGALA